MTIDEPPADARLGDLHRYAGPWAGWACAAAAVATGAALVAQGALPYAAAAVPALAFSAWTDLTRRALIDAATAAVAVSSLIAALATGGAPLMVFSAVMGAAAWAALAALRAVRGGLGGGDPAFIGANTCLLALLTQHPTVAVWIGADLFRGLAKVIVTLSALNATLVAATLALVIGFVTRKDNRSAQPCGVPVATASAATTAALLIFPELALWANPYYWM